ncbi:hypothetical protein EXT02_00320 ['Catharanthus roseus' aster yellows phytoplasma]|uniref:Uncharacterized protein n=1 Tax='Catharanthus roseus' aster yellows phytoplasma TaxID=1193712 RepID=A0A4P6M8I0_9MOLU|nr:hypothetical protein EXT02_00320 ['Catharanthus roseus' aster yellows phytoplasma]
MRYTANKSNTCFSLCAFLTFVLISSYLFVYIYNLYFNPCIYHDRPFFLGFVFALAIASLMAVVSFPLLLVPNHSFIFIN